MPQQSFNVEGWRHTGAVRIRQGFFYAWLEELWEHRDGHREWRINNGDSFLLAEERRVPSGPPPPIKND